jgi:chromosome segregation ATPase
MTKTQENHRLKAELHHIDLKLAQTNQSIKGLEARLSEVQKRSATENETEVEHKPAPGPEDAIQENKNEGLPESTQTAKKVDEFVRLQKEHKQFIADMEGLKSLEGLLAKKFHISKEKAKEECINAILEKSSSYLGFSKEQASAFKGAVQDWFIREAAILGQKGEKATSRIWKKAVKELYSKLGSILSLNTRQRTFAAGGYLKRLLYVITGKPHFLWGY